MFVILGSLKIFGRKENNHHHYFKWGSQLQNMWFFRLVTQRVTLESIT